MGVGAVLRLAVEEFTILFRNKNEVEAWMNNFEKESRVTLKPKLEEDIVDIWNKTQKGKTVD